MLSRELIGKTASFTKGNSGPFILEDISKIKKLWELELETDIIIVNKESPIYGVEGILVQPHTEISENPKKIVLVYPDTKIKILDEDKKSVIDSCWSSHSHYY